MTTRFLSKPTEEPTLNAVPLVLPLNRPQYVPSAETLISALAWEVLDYVDGRTSVGRKYQVVDRTSTKTKGEETRPTGDALVRFGLALTEAGISHELEGNVVPKAFLNSIAGVRPTRAKVQAASPMTPALALLQDTTGMTGLANPVNYAAILEAMFAMGSPSTEGDGSTMASRWLSAARRRVDTDSVLARVDASFVELYGEYRERPQADRAEVESLRGAYPNSPFGWLHDSWVKLTSDEWVDALPPRVWIDWATTTLRMGLAFGFLWEAERYRSVLQGILSNRALADALDMDQPELLPWPAAYLPPSSRSVRPAMRRRIDEGGRLRNVMARWAMAAGDPSGRGWASNSQFLNEAKAALSENSRPSALKNVYETVFYALVRRDQSDHYGLLVPRGTNVTLLDPGTEWVAMVAGLAAPAPGASNHVGRIVEELARLGLRPPVSELVRLLESAGLARGSADADHGVRVASPFGEGE